MDKEKTVNREKTQRTARLIPWMALLSILFIFSCTSHPEPAQQKLLETTSYVGNSDRFTVERVAVIYDDLAYNSRRGVYILHDNKTDKEYIGISGIGISSIGSHMEGKITREDER